MFISQCLALPEMHMKMWQINKDRVSTWSEPCIKSVHILSTDLLFLSREECNSSFFLLSSCLLSLISSVWYSFLLSLTNKIYNNKVSLIRFNNVYASHMCDEDRTAKRFLQQEVIVPMKWETSWAHLNSLSK